MDSKVSCEHLIGQKNKEFLDNYRIVHAYFVSCHSKDSKAVKDKLAVCHVCKFNGPLLLSCLSCVYFACHLHLTQHFNTFKHKFGINLTSGHVFCASCDDYTYDTDILTIASEAMKSKQMRLKQCAVKWKSTVLEHINLVRQNNNVVYENITPVPGFVNLGNTCFLNSVMQVLMHTPMLRNFILSDQHVCPFLKEPSSCIICEISRVFQQAYALKVSVISLQNLLKIFWDNTRYMASAIQHDAHECYIALLDIMHKHAINQNETDKNIRHLENCQCIIHKIFKGVLQSDIVCQSCSNVSSKIEIINDIPLYFSMDSKGKYPTNITLMECLEQFGQIEVLNDLDCTNCQTKKLSTKQLTLQKLPKVLCFIFKRFGQLSDNVSNKITTVVEFPESLDMKKLIKIKTVTGNEFINNCLSFYNTIYRLYAVICHEGFINGGHYLSYVKQRGDWYQCNDNVIRIVQFEEVLKSPAYLLFYHKEYMNYL